MDKLRSEIDGGLRSAVRSLVTACTAAALWLPQTGILGQTPAATTGLQELTQAAQIRSLSAQEAARGLAVRFQGIVTFCDTDANLLFVQDETAGIYVAPQQLMSLPAGTRVEVTGIAQPGSHLPYVAKAMLLERGFGTMPQPRAVTFEHLATGSEDSNWIETEGVVRAVQVGSSQVWLVLAADGRQIQVRVNDAAEFITHPPELVDARVRIRGVAGEPVKTGGADTRLDVRLPHPRYLRIRERGTSAIHAPLRTTEWLRNEFPTNRFVHRVRIRGSLEVEPGGDLRLRDDAGMVTLRSAALPFASFTNTTIEVAGFPDGGADSPTLTHATVSLLRPTSNAGSNGAAPASSGDFMPVLTEIDQVRRLSTEEALRHYPVRIRGVVTFAHLMDTGDFMCFVQDSTAGIFVDDMTTNRTDWRAGRAVEVEGTTDPGSYAPMILKSTMRVLGDAPMPVTRSTSIEELLTGRKDSQRVRVSGIITRVDRKPRTLTLGLLVGGTVLEVYVPISPSIPDNADQLIDALVRMDGVCATTFNAKRQLVGLFINVRRWEDLQVVRAAPAEPFDLPPRTIRSLFQFDLNEESWHRVLVRGTVTLHAPGVGVFIQDQQDGMFIPSQQSDQLAPGDVVDVIGFPRPGRPEASLMETRIRKVSSGVEPAPVPVTTVALAEGSVNNRLVELSGKLHESRSTSNEVVMVLQVGERIVEARGRSPSLVSAASRIGMESVLRLQGVWAVHGDLQAPLTTAHLWLRSPADLVVIQRPPWWTARTAAMLGGGLLTVVLGTLVWIALLRKEVRVRTEQSQKALAVLETSIAQSPAGILIADAPDGTIRWANAAALGVHGVTEKPLTGIAIRQHSADWHTFRPDGTPYPPEDLPLSRAILRGETTRNEEVIFRNARGESRWVSANAAPIRETNSQITAGIVVFHDITELKQNERLQKAISRVAEATLGARTLEELFPALHAIVAELMPARNFYVALLDAAEDIISFPYYQDEKDPPPAPRRSGRGLTEFVLKTGTPLLASAEEIEHLRLEQKVEFGGTTAHSWLGVPLRTQEHTVGVMVVQSYSSQDRYGAREKDVLVMMSYQVANAIERKRAEEALRESQEKFARAFQLSPDSIGLYRLRDGVCLDVNEGFTAATGYAREEVLNRPSLDPRFSIWVQTEDYERLISGLKAAGQVSGMEVPFRRKDGQVRAGTISARLLTIRGEECLVAITRDITERKRSEDEKAKLQAQLLQAQKMESVGRLAGGVAHDFNNMLQAILGNVDLAVQEIPHVAGVQEHLREIQKAAERSADLTRQLLAFARKQTVSPRVLDLNDSVSNTLKMLRRLIGEDIQLAWIPGARLWPVKVDPSQVDQMLANLTVNARDAIAGSGKITIETANVRLDAAAAGRIDEGVTGDYVRLTVGDNGCGMDAETQSHLFEPFFTTKAPGRGTGLGLATVYGIVKQNDGLIHVTSRLQTGTTFEIYLPRAHVAPESTFEVVEPKSWRGNETVLLVEDESQILAVGQKILQQHGYTVLAAGMPSQALELAQTHQGPIHLLISDVVMPGMNGRELREHLLALRPELKCLFISGYTADVIAHQGVLEDGFQFLQKPFNVTALTRRVRETLDAA